MGAVGGYRLVGGTAMPPLLLDDEEAVAIAVGLRTLVSHAIEGGEDASVRALAKLQQVLPPRLRGRVAAVAAATGALVWDVDPIEPERLSRALARDRQSPAAAFRIRGRRSVRVAPNGRTALGGRRRPALVPDRMGRRPQGLADVPSGPDARSVAAAGTRRRARASGEGRGGLAAGLDRGHGAYDRGRGAGRGSRQCGGRADPERGRDGGTDRRATLPRPTPSRHDSHGRRCASSDSRRTSWSNPHQHSWTTCEPSASASRTRSAALDGPGGPPIPSGLHLMTLLHRPSGTACSAGDHRPAHARRRA